MLTDYEHLLANLIIAIAIAEHLAEEGDPSAFDALDNADLAYFDHDIVRKVMQDNPVTAA